MPRRQLLAEAGEDHDARAPADNRDALAAGALEGDDRHAAAVPGLDAEVPGRRPGHFLQRLEARHLRHAGARHEQPLVEERHEEAVKFLLRAHVAARRTSGSIACRSWPSW